MNINESTYGKNFTKTPWEIQQKAAQDDFEQICIWQLSFSMAALTCTE